MRDDAAPFRAGNPPGDLASRAQVAYTWFMDGEPLPLDFSALPLGSLYEERLVEDLLLLVDVVSACREGDDSRLAELGVWPAGSSMPNPV